jgi:hypothetical protein
MYSCSIPPILATVCDAAVVPVPMLIFGSQTQRIGNSARRRRESQGTLGESETWDESYESGRLLFLIIA